MRNDDAEKRVTAAIVIACMVALLMLVTMFAVENRDIKQQLQKYQNQKIFDLSIDSNQSDGIMDAGNNETGGNHGNETTSNQGIAWHVS